MTDICMKCEGNLITSEVEILKILYKDNLSMRYLEEKNRKDNDEICWRCHSEYWEGIESIFNQLDLNKDDVFFILLEHFENKCEQDYYDYNDLDDDEKEAQIWESEKIIKKMKQIPF